MSHTENILSVKILDKHYKVKCHPDEARELQASASYLNEQMNKLHQTGGLPNADSVAVVAALNICHELQILKKEKEQFNQKVDEMTNKITATIAKNDEYNV